MNSPQVSFSSTRLKARKRTGILEPDASGYYTFVVGGLNCYNKSREFYTLKGAEALFSTSGTLMRKIDRGVLFGELGHPDLSMLSRQSERVGRMCVVLENNICVHFRRLYLDHEYGKNHPEYNNPQLIGIIAELTPSGVHAEQLRAALKNPHQNVCFSLRGFTKDYWVGSTLYRELMEIVTWDQVSEMGIEPANKWDNSQLATEGQQTLRLETLNTLLEKPRSGTALEHQEERSALLRMKEVLAPNRFWMEEW